MRTRISVVLLATIMVLGLMFIIVRKSRQPYEIKHGFNRLFTSGKPLKLIKKLSAAYPLYSAGYNDSNIYFHTDDPHIIAYTDTACSTIKTIHLPIDSTASKGLANAFSTYVRYPEAFIFAYNLAAILVYDLQTGTQTTIPTPSNYSNAVQISDSAFILKYFTGDSTDQSFCKLNIYTKQLTKAERLTEDLSSGGMLLYNDQDVSCYYIHHYNNRITIFDTAFRSLRATHTIDTFTQSQIEYISRNKTGSSEVLYKPDGTRMLINYLSQLYRGHLYVNSLIKADNETLLTDQSATVIDIYSTNMDKYMESIYIPVPRKQHLKSFRIFGRKILATYTNQLALYEFPGLSK
ncbi:hypothetical protein [Chitinophaga filiformis]|uniref:TolB-like 6-blade propeller-like n=1 Tax=Chitinophaga filiformis TaxID=104663 RepID=A0ABY4HYB5_CHIFI|nr:hypothetical protein [Chitinophaga filiformis]UPK68797.1 hypothetical protein MYF79_27945 [Chitinophaga filiformis]